MYFGSHVQSCKPVYPGPVNGDSRRFMVSNFNHLARMLHNSNYRGFAYLKDVWFTPCPGFVDSGRFILVASKSIYGLACT